jgi:hypothetical protein
LWLYKNFAKEQKTKSEINKAAMAVALNVAVYALESFIFPELQSFGLSKAISILMFATCWRSVVQQVGRDVDLMNPVTGGQAEPSIDMQTNRSVLYVFSKFIAIIIVPVGLAFSMHMFYSLLHSDFCPHKPSPRHKLCDKFDDVFSQLDAHTRAMFYVMKTTNYSAGAHQTAASMRMPTSWNAQTLKKYNLFQEIDIPMHEEGHIFAFHDIVNSFQTWMRWFPVKKSLEVLSSWVNPLAFPDDDVFVRWPSLEDGIEALKFAGGDALENIALNVPSLNVTSDDAIGRLAMVGLAAHHLRACRHNCDADAEFEVDYTDFSSMPVRQGYEGYGAIAYFSRTIQVTRIHCSHCGGPNVSMMLKPGDELWEHAKWVFKVSMLLTCTIKDHLVGTHLMCVTLGFHCTSQ